MRTLVIGILCLLTYLVGYDKGIHDTLCETARRKMLVYGQGSGPISADGPACAPWIPFTPPK